MNLTATSATRFGSIRPIGARITVIEREWLPNILRRIGYQFGVSAKDIADWCGLANLGPDARCRLGNRLSNAVCDRIAEGLGVPTDQLQTTVMSYLPDELVSLGPCAIPRPLVNWTRGTGTRFCVQCLLERPGVFYTHWRLWWCFICERHNTILRGSCPSCHSEIMEASVTERWCRDPMICWARLDDGSFCQHSLSATWDEDAINDESPMMRAQLAIAKPWAGDVVSIPNIPSATFRGTAIALLAADDVDQIADLAELDAADLAGLFDHSARTGIAPPTNHWRWPRSQEPPTG